MWSSILVLLGSLIGLWAIFKYLILVEMRLDANTFKTLFEVCKDQPKFIIQEEFVSEVKAPVVYIAIYWFKDAPVFWLNHTERLLTAGWSGKDSVCMVICFRWSYGRLKKFLFQKLKEMQLTRLGVPVELITPNYTDKIGSLKRSCSQPWQPFDKWQDIEAEIAEVFQGQREKTSALLYGFAGNGKTSFIKYIATKYRIPIKIITFSPDFSNLDLMCIFSQITPKCIVLLEDFDNYFHGRKCVLGTDNKNIKFTFDAILNGLDGVYNTYENVVFIMTVNDIELVDVALRNRPSRFKYVRCFDNPTTEIRASLLPTSWVSATEGLNLDQIMRLKEFHEEGVDLTAAMNKLEKKVPQEELERIAYYRSLERAEQGIEGDHLDDWQYAVGK